MKWQRATVWTLFIVCVVSVGAGAYRAREAVAAWFGGPLFLFGSCKKASVNCFLQKRPSFAQILVIVS